VLLVTHDVEHGLRLADHVMVMRRGRCVLSEPVAGDPVAFRRRYEALIA
jgi:ABC-type cobalamin/Fe3+-siderophores transport system ATPase subunit